MGQSGEMRKSRPHGFFDPRTARSRGNRYPRAHGLLFPLCNSEKADLNFVEPTLITENPPLASL